MMKIIMTESLAESVCSGVCVSRVSDQLWRAPLQMSEFFSLAKGGLENDNQKSKRYYIFFRVDSLILFSRKLS